ncbi:M23 family metallopeptidase [Candidatus Wolfebacteria bacterium]|nr:M23 family metallopeptidase [Candidatus Wolfebacteria bacterium]
MTNPDTQYGHLGEVSNNPHTGLPWQIGDEVHRGEQVGTVGNSNGCLPYHLHFEVRKFDDLASVFPCKKSEIEVAADYTNPTDFINLNRVPLPCSGFLNFVEGNPCEPGDGVFINATPDPNHANQPFFELMDLQSMGPFKESGFTVAAFFPSVGAGPHPSLSLRILTVRENEPSCSINFSASGTSLGSTFFNGVEGLSSAYTPLFIQHMVTFADFHLPQCGFTAADLFVWKVRIYDGDNLVDLLDAFIIRQGENNPP